MWSVLSTKQPGVKLSTSHLSSPTHVLHLVTRHVYGHSAQSGKDKVVFHRKGASVMSATDLTESFYDCEFNRCVTVGHSGAQPPLCFAHEITISPVDNVICAIL